MEKNETDDMYVKTIEDIEKVTFVVILHKHRKRFSFYCLKKFAWKDRLLKPFIENIPFGQFDAMLDLYETAATRNEEGLWKVIERSLKKSVFR